MSVTEVIQCDSCGTRTDDFYKDFGWIEIGSHTSSFKITISRGRTKEGPAKNCGFVTRDKPLHFCSQGCLLCYLNRLMQEAERAEPCHATE